jgi:signal transduction histidine kinase
MFKTLRSRLTVSIAAAVFISLALTSLVFYSFLSFYARRDAERKLRRQADEIANQAQEVNKPELYRLISTAEQLTGVRVFLVDQNERLIGPPPAPQMRMGIRRFKRQTVPLDKPRITEQYLPAVGSDVLLVSSPVEGNPMIKAVVLAAPLEDLSRAKLSFFYLLILSAALSFIIAAVIALLLSGSILKPIHKVTQAADKAAGGDLKQVVVTESQDEIGRLARSFNYMIERVRRSYEAQRDFTSNVSHEFRTPLTSIEGYSEALLSGVAKSKEDTEKSLKVINEESKRLKRLTESLLTLSRIDADALNLELTDIDLPVFLERIKEKLRLQLEDADVDLKIDSDPGIHSIKTDPDRLEQVIINLVDNAVRHSAAGSSVNVRTGKDSPANMPNRAMIMVSDKGPGIPEQDTPRIFDRFYRVGKEAKGKGTGAGLGLAIAREMVEALGGSIDVASAPGKGTTFTVYIPS